MTDVMIRPAVEVRPLPSPRSLREAVTVPASVAASIDQQRAAISAVIHGRDRRLLAIVGPCSIHDAGEALEYAAWLRTVGEQYRDQVLLVMRVYVEKARTRVGWKGMLYGRADAESGDVGDGILASRRLMLEIAALGLPVATEFVSLLAPQYLDDLVSWAAIGARTVASPAHREMASALSCPVGFKNPIDGNVGIAVDAAVAAASPQRFLGVDRDGRPAQITSSGNQSAHIVLRGGTTPNFDATSIADAAALLAAHGRPTSVIVDASHGNAGGDYRNQLGVVESLATQVADGSRVIGGVMLESNLVAGRQSAAGQLRRGQSVTDGCIDRDQTLVALGRLAEAWSMAR